MPLTNWISSTNPANVAIQRCKLRVSLFIKRTGNILKLKLSNTKEWCPLIYSMRQYTASFQVRFGLPQRSKYNISMKREREARSFYNVMPKKGKDLEIDEFQNRIAMYTSQNMQPVKLKHLIKKKKMLLQEFPFSSISLVALRLTGTIYQCRRYFFIGSWNTGLRLGHQA